MIEVMRRDRAHHRDAIECWGEAVADDEDLAVVVADSLTKYYGSPTATLTGS